MIEYMTASSVSRAFLNRFECGSGSFCIHSENGSIKKLNSETTVVIALPISSASLPTSAAEQRFADDLQRQVHHFAVDVANVAVLPFACHRVGVFDHRAGIFGDPVAVKGRLDHSPLPQMGLALAGQQALAEHHFRPLQRPPLYKFIGVYDQHVADHIRMIHKEIRSANRSSASRRRPVLPVRSETRSRSRQKRRICPPISPAGCDGGTGNYIFVGCTEGHLEFPSKNCYFYTL